MDESQNMDPRNYETKHLFELLLGMIRLTNVTSEWRIIKDFAQKKVTRAREGSINLARKIADCLRHAIKEGRL